MDETPQQALAKLSSILPKYAQELGRDLPDVLARKGADVTFQISREARLLMPAKGEITANRTTALAGGQGIRVRPSAKAYVLRKFNVTTSVGSRRQIGKRFLKKKTRLFQGQDLWQQMIKREIAMRESGRGFTSFGARVPGIKTLKGPGQTTERRGRYSNLLASAGITLGNDDATLKITYAPATSVKSTLGDSLATPAGQQAIARGIAATLADTLQYMERKADEAAFRTLSPAFPTSQN